MDLAESNIVVILLLSPVMHSELKIVAIGSLSSRANLYHDQSDITAILK